MRGRDAADLPSPSTLASYLAGANSGFASSKNADLVGLDGYLGWLREPVALRAISAHSTATRSVIGVPASAAGLEASIGIRPFLWRRVEGRIPMLVPSFERNLGTGVDLVRDATMAVHRTFWEAHALDAAGQSFVVHDGCEVASPANLNQVSYANDMYAEEQNGESILFFTNTLAIMARAKVFNDHRPGGAMAAIKSAGNFGAALPGYIWYDANDGALTTNATGLSWPAHRERTLQRKRSYYWNVLGDGTLRLRY